MNAIAASPRTRFSLKLYRDLGGGGSGLTLDEFYERMTNQEFLTWFKFYELEAEAEAEAIKAQGNG